MKQKIMLATLIGILAILTVFGIVERLDNTTYLFVLGIGTPDAYNNVIMNLTIHQWNGSIWNLLQTVSTDTNWTQRVVDSQPINITVCWRLNNTLASSTNEAQSYTRVLMNLTGIWTDEELNATGSVTSDANYYYGYEFAYWNQTGYPQAGVTYDVATRYDAYY